MATLQKRELEPLPAVLRRLRGEAGLTQEQLAFAVQAQTNSGLTASAVSQIERGAIRPEIPTMEGLRVVLGDEIAATLDYELALARGQLDDRLVGGADARANLERVRALLLAKTPADRKAIATRMRQRLEEAAQREAKRRAAVPAAKRGPRRRGPQS